jgi:hypothetical protein
MNKDPTFSFRWAIKLDQATYDMLQAMRDQEGVNTDRWIMEAIRAKAGLSPRGK